MIGGKRGVRMAEERKCLICGTTKCDNWIERQNIAGVKAYFCGPEHYEEYKKRAAKTGVCEFC
jgi:hypothetical protein